MREELVFKIKKTIDLCVPIVTQQPPATQGPIHAIEKPPCCMCVCTVHQNRKLSLLLPNTHTHRGDFELGNPESVLFGKANKRNMLVVRNFTHIHTDASECSAPDQVE